jgi:hypothetical protein
MRRGRPRDEYSQGEFRGEVLGTLTRRSFSLRALETLSGVNRGTLSAVLNGKRPCERDDRAAIMRALGFGADLQARFLAIVPKTSAEHARVLLDSRVSDDPQLRRGQVFMSRAQFSEAHQEFTRVFNRAEAAGDSFGQAEAAGWLAWFHSELEEFGAARHWIALSIGSVERHLGLTTYEIIDSVSRSQSRSARSEQAAQVLSRALRIYSKVLTVRIVHNLEFPWLAEAQQAFRRSLALDECLQLPELAHDLRWKAVALSAEDRSQVKDVERLLSASREQLAGSSGEASLIREQGIIRWQKNRLARAADFLWEAKERLAVYADARALGPTFCVLSKIIVQDSGDFRQARRYALIAAGLHPYGYVLNHCADQLRATSAVDRQHDMEDLQAGRKPFDIVHRVMEQVAAGSPNTGAQLVVRNLARVSTVLRGGTRANVNDWKR